MGWCVVFRIGRKVPCSKLTDTLCQVLELILVMRPLAYADVS